MFVFKSKLQLSLSFFGRIITFAVVHALGKYVLFSILLNNMRYSRKISSGTFFKKILGMLSTPADILFFK